MADSFFSRRALSAAVEYSSCLPANLFGERFYDWQMSCIRRADEAMALRAVEAWAVIVLTFVAVVLAFWVVRGLARCAFNRPRAYPCRPPVVASGTLLEKAGLGGPKSAVIQCHSPATGQLLGTVEPATPATIFRAVLDAHVAQLAWRTTTFRQRRAVLRTMLAHILAHQESYCRVVCLDTGKSMVDVQLGEIMITVEILRWMLAHGEDALATEKQSTNLLLWYKRNRVRREPFGLVAAIASWDYPFYNLLGPVISSIFAGNGIVVSAAEHTAWSARFIADVARNALAAHGHSPNLVQPLTCLPDNEDMLTSYLGVSHVTFVGCEARHRGIPARPPTLECAQLGGKDTVIVLDTVTPADFERIVEALMRGTFLAEPNQASIGIARIVGSQWMTENIIEAILQRKNRLGCGPFPRSADVGVMISEEAVQRMQQLVDDAYDDGARILCGGRRQAHAVYPAGHYYPPTLLSLVDQKMAIAREACFGHTVVIMEARSRRAADLLTTAHAGHRLGPGCSVFGRESDPCLWEVVDGLRSSTVTVNDFGATYASRLPFGCAGSSGYSRFASAEGLRALCRTKTVSEDWCPWRGKGEGFRVRSVIPQQLRWPAPDQDMSWRFAKRVLDFGSGLSVWTRIEALAGMVRRR